MHVVVLCSCHACSLQWIERLPVALLQYLFLLLNNLCLCAAMSEKFGTIKAGSEVDAGKVMKLAQKIEQAMAENLVYPEPKQIDPRCILVAPRNRDGAPPNVMHVHHQILN